MEKVESKINNLDIPHQFYFNQFLKNNQSLNNNENKSFERDLKIINEDKNIFDMPIPYFENNLRKKGKDFIPIHLLLDNEIEETYDKYKRNSSHETLENGINLEEQNSKYNYLKINNNLFKHKNKNRKDIKKLKINYCQSERYLNNYSNEEANNKKLNKLKDNFNLLKNSINSNKQNKNIVYIDDKNDKNDKDINLLPDIQIDKDLFDKIEYGIDENGNPFNIKNNNEKLKNIENNKTNKIKKPIAFIIQQKEKGKNYLIDKNGKLIPKNEDGDFIYKYKNIHILIKDFDVQRPELRIYGTKKSDTLILNDENDESKLNEIKKMNKQNYFKDKLFNRNISFNNLKAKYITYQNNIEINNLLNKKLLNFKSESPIVINKNLENIEKKNNEKHYYKWKFKENSKTDDRERYINDKKRNEILFRKINPKNLNINNSRIEHPKYEKDVIKRTSNILNKKEFEFYSNRHNLSNSQFEINKKIKLNNSDYLIKYGMNKNLTKNNISLKEINNSTSISTRIKLNKYKRHNKRGGSAYFNCKNEIILKSCINTNRRINNDNNLLNYKNETENNFRKNKKAVRIISAIDKISNSIKDIKNTIEKNIMRLKYKSEIINNSNKTNIPLSTTISTCNSQNISNISIDTPSFSNYYSSCNNELSRINNNIATNLKNQKDNKISSIFKSILNKNISNLMTNYTNRIDHNEIKNENINKKIGLYDYEDEIKNNENKINSFLNKGKNKIKLNLDTKLTQRNKYIIKPNNSLLFNRNNNKSKILNLKYNESCNLIEFNKLNDNKDNNYNVNNNNQLTYKHNNSNINLTQQKIKLNEIKTYIKPKLNSKILRYNIKLNYKSNSIGSLNELYYNSLNNKINN